MKYKLKLAIIEDDILLQTAFKSILDSEHSVDYFETTVKFLESANGFNNYNLILLDLCHPGDREGTQSVASIPLIKSRFPHAELIVQSGIRDTEIMRQVVAQGASKFVLKDNILDQLKIWTQIQTAIESQKIQLDDLLIGDSPCMKNLKKELLQAKIQNSQDVLIIGETGTGKELCAQAIHVSPGPLISVNASAIPEDLLEAEFFGSEKGAFTGSHQTRMGHFESASGGTLFIDEVQSLSLKHQAKLLRVLENRVYTRVGTSIERPIKCRVVFASNRDLRNVVEQGQFREDFYYRISSLTLRVPPLRMRGHDLSLLTDYFMKQANVNPERKTFTSDGLATLLNSAYDWPGNVRELKNVLMEICRKTQIPVIGHPECSLIFDQHIRGFENESTQFVKSFSSKTPAQLIDWSADFDTNVERYEAYLIGVTVEKYGSQKARDILKIGRSRFYQKLSQFKKE